MSTRKLPVDAARELIYAPASREIDGYTRVEIKDGGSDRWMSHHNLIIKDGEGRLWSSWYEKGLTEYQDYQPWEEQEFAEFVEVQAVTRMVEVTDYVPVDDPSSRTGGAG